MLQYFATKIELFAAVSIKLKENILNGNGIIELSYSRIMVWQLTALISTTAHLSFWNNLSLHLNFITIHSVFDVCIFDKLDLIHSILGLKWLFFNYCIYVSNWLEWNYCIKVDHDLWIEMSWWFDIRGWNWLLYSCRTASKGYVDSKRSNGQWTVWLDNFLWMEQPM